MQRASRRRALVSRALAAYEQCLALCPTARNAAQNKLLALNCLSLQGEECTDAHIAWGRQFVQQACEAYPALASRRAVSRQAAESDEMDDGDKSGSDSPADGDGAAALNSAIGWNQPPQPTPLWHLWRQEPFRFPPLLAFRRSFALGISTETERA